MRKYTDPTQRPADEWDHMATQCALRSQESWERSDSDGVLSQWASDCMSSFYRDVAKAAEADGRRQIAWLFDAITGRPIEGWRWVRGRYGSSVAIGEYGDTVWFHPSRARNAVRREVADRAKGFVWGLVECEVVLFQFGETVLQTGYERKRGSKLTIIRVGDYELEAA